MANTRSAKKNVRRNESRRIKNLARLSAVKTAIKKVYASLEAGIQQVNVEKLLKDAVSKLARAKGKNSVHKNTASRKISRLSKRVAGAFKTQKA